jgi:zona occludens toxin (predicted ATPase)
MGSGKTYEVVSVVILAALASGRRVVSNIAGLNYAEFCRILQTEKNLVPDRVGKLISVSHDAVLEPSFWRTDDNFKRKGEMLAADEEPFIEPGDLLVLDEVWRFWEGFSSKDMPARVMNFFRMHRHFTHQITGITCDVALISQDVMDIARRVRGVVEETYVMKKMTVVGSTKRYRVDIFSGTNIRRKPLRSIYRSYNKKYFALYQSHSQKGEGADAVEQNIDGRGNIFRRPFFIIILPAMLIGLILSVYYIWGFFHHDFQSDKKPGISRQGNNNNKIRPESVNTVNAPINKNPLMPRDRISYMFESFESRLSFYSRSGTKVHVRIEFINPSGVRKHFSESELLLYGWRVFYSGDGGAALVTNGQESHVVVTDFRVSGVPVASGK